MGSIHSSSSNGGRVRRHNVARVKRGDVVGKRREFVGKRREFVGKRREYFFRPCSSAFNSLLLWFCLSLFLLVVFRYQPIRVKIFLWFPGVVACGIALPLY